MSGAQRLARWIVGLGVVAFWAVLALLSAGAGLPLMDSILLAMLLAALPTFALAQVPLIDGVRAAVAGVARRSPSVPLRSRRWGACWPSGATESRP